MSLGGSLSLPWQPFAVVHLALAGGWVGAMGYSLGVVQPATDRSFPDSARREEFLATLAQGNRWRVVVLVAVLLATAAGVAGLAPAPVAIGYVAVLVLQAAAAALFVHVSWRHWPARVFALPEELPGYQRRLRALAWAMLALVGTGLLVALSVSVGGG